MCGSATQTICALLRWVIARFFLLLCYTQKSMPAGGDDDDRDDYGVPRRWHTFPCHSVDDDEYPSFVTQSQMKQQQHVEAEEKRKVHSFYSTYSLYAKDTLSRRVFTLCSCSEFQRLRTSFIWNRTLILCVGDAVVAQLRYTRLCDFEK